MQKYWFRAKRYGWGWAEPLTWQGWAVYFGYGGFLIYYFLTVDQRSNSNANTLLGIAPQFMIATALLLVICYLKGEKPRWRWGEK